MHMEQNHITEIKQVFHEKTANVPALTQEQEKQILHEIIQERIEKQQSGAQATQKDDDTKTDEGAKEAAVPVPAPSPVPHPAAPSTQKDATVQTLVNMAVHEDLYKATKMAYETKNPFLIDQYHDTLVNEFYELIKLQEQE